MKRISGAGNKTPAPRRKKSLNARKKFFRILIIGTILALVVIPLSLFLFHKGDGDSSTGGNSGKTTKTASKVELQEHTIEYEANASSGSFDVQAIYYPSKINPRLQVFSKSHLTQPFKATGKSQQNRGSILVTSQSSAALTCQIKIDGKIVSNSTSSKGASTKGNKGYAMAKCDIPQAQKTSH